MILFSFIALANILLLVVGIWSLIMGFCTKDKEDSLLYLRIGSVSIALLIILIVALKILISHVRY